eukprot:CAMPEP_0117489360 /NCGR_PEP_ID=MMETSP0784-20121206/16994_1 /TAXON_ID=39447 /ORGANISM="" /LENGTH=756 /DNA_ID=CAMNT_0005284083 /DNA_START=108 /DNA_END=2378 /DNA_ORIENTATION=+
MAMSSHVAFARFMTLCIVPVCAGLFARSSRATRPVFPDDGDFGKTLGNSGAMGSPPAGASSWGEAEWPRHPGDARPSDDVLGGTLWIEVVLGILVVVGGVVGLFVVVRTKRTSQGAWLHTYALMSAALWRHFRRRAIVTQFLRIVLPMGLLFAIHSFREWLPQALNKVAGNIPLGDSGVAKTIAHAVVEGMLVEAMLLSVLSTTQSFGSIVAGERESGFRHLLHVSGLSRPAYFGAVVLFDAIVPALTGIVLMLAVAALFLQVRMVLWTSFALLFTMILLLCFAVATMSLLVSFAGSSRRASYLSHVLSLVAGVGCPFLTLAPDVPNFGRQSLVVLAMPVFPAFRGLFKCVTACVDGQCLVVHDVWSAFAEGRFAGPYSMVLGTDTDWMITSPEALVSFVGLLLLQLLVAWSAIIALDMRSHPYLHVHAQQVKSTADDAVLTASGLVHWYGWFQRRPPNPAHHVLRGVTFKVQAGSMLGMLGPNGAGKTTTIRCITGEEKPCEGDVAITAPTGSSSFIALCPQETVVNGDLTVKQNLLFFAFLRGKVDCVAKECVAHVLRATNLVEKRDWYPDTLSGGMRRRLAVGCAMVGSPAVVILDEPTTGLDPLSRRGIWSTIMEVKDSGGCCLLTTHMLEEAEALCEHLVVLNQGTIVAGGSVQSLKETWGAGYMLNVETDLAETECSKRFLNNLLAAEDRTPIKIGSKGQMTFRFTRDEEALGHLIIAIARGKGTSGIKHWGVSQASLEDAYLRILQKGD